MSKKYVKRFIVWALLVLSLTAVTYYNRVLFITPLKNDVEYLETEEQNTENSIKSITATVDKYNNLMYDENTFKTKIPSGFDEEEIHQKYIIRPTKVAEAKLVDFSPFIDSVPTNLKLSSEIKAKKVTVTLEVDYIDQFYTFLSELTSGMRSIYIGNFTYSLPGEKNTSTGTISITLDYYVFYTKANE